MEEHDRPDLRHLTAAGEEIRIVGIIPLGTGRLQPSRRGCAALAGGRNAGEREREATMIKMRGSAVGAMSLSCLLTGCLSTGEVETGGSGGNSTAHSSTAHSTGSAQTSSSTGDPFVPPSAVNINLVGAVVRPWDSTGTQWDGVAVSQQDKDTITALVPNYGALIAELASLASGAWAPPDPFGAAYIYINGIEDPKLTVAIPTQMDIFKTDFQAGTGWIHVPVDKNMRFGVRLWDEDVVNDDTIGSVELNYEDVIDALKAKQIVQIRTDDQFGGTILYIGVSVLPDQ